MKNKIIISLLLSSTLLLSGCSLFQSSPNTPSNSGTPDTSTSSDSRESGSSGTDSVRKTELEMSKITINYVNETYTLTTTFNQIEGASSYNFRILNFSNSVVYEEENFKSGTSMSLEEYKDGIYEIQMKAIAADETKNYDSKWKSAQSYITIEHPTPETPPVQPLIMGEITYKVEGDEIEVTFENVPPAEYYEMRLANASGEAKKLISPYVSGQRINISDLENGEYTVSVRCFSDDGRVSPWANASSTFTIDKPIEITDFEDENYHLIKNDTGWTLMSVNLTEETDNYVMPSKYQNMNITRFDAAFLKNSAFLPNSVTIANSIKNIVGTNFQNFDYSMVEVSISSHLRSLGKYIMYFDNKINDLYQDARTAKIPLNWYCKQRLEAFINNQSNSRITQRKLSFQTYTPSNMSTTNGSESGKARAEARLLFDYSLFGNSAYYRESEIPNSLSPHYYNNTSSFTTSTVESTSTSATKRKSANYSINFVCGNGGSLVTPYFAETFTGDEDSSFYESYLNITDGHGNRNISLNFTRTSKINEKSFPNNAQSAFYNYFKTFNLVLQGEGTLRFTNNYQRNSFDETVIYCSFSDHLTGTIVFDNNLELNLDVTFSNSGNWGGIQNANQIASNSQVDYYLLDLNYTSN